MTKMIQNVIRNVYKKSNQMSKKLFKHHQYLLLLFSISLNLSCGLKVKKATSFATSQVTISNFMPNCYNTRSGSTPINFKVSITPAYIVTGTTGFVYGTTATYTASSHNHTATIPVQIPSDNHTYTELKIMISGTECSTCALIYDGYDVCEQTVQGTGITAGEPQQENTVAIGETYQPFIQVSGGWTTAHNVPGSCGCTVPH